MAPPALGVGVTFATCPSIGSASSLFAVSLVGWVLGAACGPTAAGGDDADRSGRGHGSLRQAVCCGGGCRDSRDARRPRGGRRHIRSCWGGRCGRTWPWRAFRRDSARHCTVRVDGGRCVVDRRGGERRLGGRPPAAVRCTLALGVFVACCAWRRNVRNHPAQVRCLVALGGAEATKEASERARGRRRGGREVCSRRSSSNNNRG